MDSNYVMIFSGNFIIVQLVLDRLQDAGITGIIKDESESGRLAGFGSSIQGYQELYVTKEEVSQAAPIVEAVNAELKL